MKKSVSMMKYLQTITLLLITVNSILAQDLPKELDRLYQEVTTDPGLHFNGTVLVAEHGKIIYQHSVGYANIGEKMLNSGSTRFHLASLSKVFTAVAVMQMVEKGKLKLDDSLVSFLPDFPYPEITIRELLSHTSGLPDFREIFELNKEPGSRKGLTNADIIPALRKYGRLAAPPGTKWSYSSVGYGLLALVVEKISKLNFQTYVSEFICEPGGMRNTYVLTPFYNYPDTSRAVPYINPGPTSASMKAGDSLRTDLSNPWQSIVGPGLVVSSAADLLLFDEALYGNRILQPATSKEMYTAVKLADGSIAKLDHAPINAGLGWGIDIDHSSGLIVSHNGGSPGVSTILLRNVEKNQTVIVLENTNNMGILAFGVNAMNILNHKPIRRFGPPTHP